MKRRAHLWSFDTEDDSKGNAFLYNFYHIDSGRHFTFTNQIDALDFACSRPNSHFWAVNLEYDIINLFRGYMELLEYCFAGTSKLLFCELPDDRIKFIDTMNHWKMGVKAMGERISMPKMEMAHGETYTKKELNLALKDLSQESRAQKMILYCRRDTEITGLFVKSMNERYQKIGAELKTTIASSTLSFFEGRFYKRVTHAFTEEQLDWFHRGYYGGRTEIFFNKPVAGKIFYHDVNGLYASCLKNGIYPKLENYYEITPNEIAEGKTISLELQGIAEVEVKAPKNLSIPYLATRFEGKLIFPLGTFTGIYTYFELREALQLGYEITTVLRAIEFTESFNPFEKFITEVSQQRANARLSGDSLLADLWKDFSNHAYGKFAQNNESVKILPFNKMSPCDCDLDDTVCTLKYHLKGGDQFFGDRGELVFRKEKTEYARYANCVWAMYVTAQARHVLYPYLTEVEKRGGLLIYCDTDSVMYENKTQLFEDSSELGKMKLERPKNDKKEVLGDFYVYAYFRLPKLYCLKKPDGVINYRTKGVPACSDRTKHKAGCQCVSAEFFEKGKTTFKKPNKMRESLRRNLNAKKEKMIMNFWEERPKEIRGKYTKRRVLKSGHTRPLFLNHESMNN